MERSRGQHQLLAIFLLALLSAAGAEPCEPLLLSYIISTSCAGNLEHPTEACCEGVVAAVGMGFGDVVNVPCLCRVAKHPYLALTGIDIYSILRMYPICGGVYSVGPHTAEMCQDRD